MPPPSPFILKYKLNNIYENGIYETGCFSNIQTQAASDFNCSITNTENYEKKIQNIKNNSFLELTNLSRKKIKTKIIKRSLKDKVALLDNLKLWYWIENKPFNPEIISLEEISYASERLAEIFDNYEFK